MKFRALNPETDYPTMVKWWKHWGHPVVGVSDLPMTGYVVTDSETAEPLLVGFLIHTNAPFAFVETLVARPEGTWQEREAAVRALVTGVETIARANGYKRLLAIPQNPRIAEKAQSAGFTIDKVQSFLCVKEI